MLGFLNLTVFHQAAKYGRWRHTVSQVDTNGLCQHRIKKKVGRIRQQVTGIIPFATRQEDFSGTPVLRLPEFE